MKYIILSLWAGFAIDFSCLVKEEFYYERFMGTYYFYCVYLRWELFPCRHLAKQEAKEKK